MNFTLRPWRPEDASAIVPYADDPLVAESAGCISMSVYSGGRGGFYSLLHRAGGTGTVVPRH